METRNKSFFSRPEGKTGAVCLVGLTVAGVFAIPFFTASILSMLSTPLGSAALFAILGLICFVLFNNKARSLVWFLYQGMMRKITGLFVQLDPIKILESYIEYLYNNLREMNNNIVKLRGQLTKLRDIVAQNNSEMDRSLRIASQAKQQEKNELVTLHMRQYGRLKENNNRYNVLIGKMDVLYKVLSKIHTNSSYLIQDTENEVRMRKQEAGAVMSGYSAMKHAMNIISGDPDKKMLYDMANEALAEDVSLKIGELDRFIELSGSFIDSIDLQNAVYEQQGLEQLELLMNNSKLGNDFKLPDSDKYKFEPVSDSADGKIPEKKADELVRDFTNLYNTK